jgi:hypothetical protein
MMSYPIILVPFLGVFGKSRYTYNYIYLSLHNIYIYIPKNVFECVYIYHYPSFFARFWAAVSHLPEAQSSLSLSTLAPALAKAKTYLEAQSSSDTYVARGPGGWEIFQLSSGCETRFTQFTPVG